MELKLVSCKLYNGNRINQTKFANINQFNEQTFYWLELNLLEFYNIK